MRSRVLAASLCALMAGSSCVGDPRAVAPVQGASASATAAAPRPNVIVIIADDLGYADISAYGIDRLKTPNIDRIGNEGVKFTDGYVTAPVCSPSRAALQTGRYQQRFGFEYNNGPASRDVGENLGIAPSEIVLGQALKSVGYRTGIVGKWHLGANAPYYPTNRGYDEFVGILGGATPYMRPDHPDLVSWHPEGEADRPRNQLNAVVEGPERTVVRNEDQYLTDYFAQRAAEFVTRNARSDNPYFLYTAFTAPHDPVQTTRKYYDRFPHIEDKKMRVYASMISALDEGVGRILDAVERSGEADNTMIVFLSDNGCAAYLGYCACEPMRGGKLSHYEGGVRVPYLVRWPAKLKAGTVYRNPVSTLDIFPTALAAAGGQLPSDRVYDGKNLVPYVTGQNRNPPHEALMWRRSPMVSIRKGDWKLWRDVDGKFTYLFDLKNDPNETRNLATAQPAKVQELNRDLQFWSATLQDPKWPSRPHVEYSVCGTPFKLPI